MSDEFTLEVAVDTTDEDLLREIEHAVADANPRRWPTTRDMGTVIMVVSDITGLINALLALKAAFDKKTSAQPISIVIRNENRDQLTLADVTEQSARELVADASDEPSD